MLIVTPQPGTWPEPRPQHLITGDRAIQVLDTVSSAALQAAGIKVATVSPQVFDKLTGELVPEVMEGIDPVTGKLLASVMPAYLSPAGIADVDIRGVDGKIEEAYLPARLSPAALAALAGSGGSTTATNTNITVTGTATIATTNTTDLTATGTVTLGSVTATSLEAQRQTLVNQSVEPAAPAAGKIKVYTDTTGRVIYKDENSTLRRGASYRIVDVLPSSSDAVTGDEVIINGTGERRVFLDSVRGWRLAGPHTVTSLTERNALAAKYDGMTVFCNFGTPQNHIYSGGKWRGTKVFRVPTASTQLFPLSSVNDTNWRRWATTRITDPGYEYQVEGHFGLEIVALGLPTRSWVYCGYQELDGSNYNNWLTSFQDSHAGYNGQVHRYDFSGINYDVQSGTKDWHVSWRVADNRANAYSMNYESALSYLVIPA